MSRYQIPDPNRVRKPRAQARPKSITLKGNLANLFVKAHSGKPIETEQELLERIALSVHLSMTQNDLAGAVDTLKSLRMLQSPSSSEATPAIAKSAADIP